MASCDICRKRQPARDLVEIRESFRPAGIRDICRTCEQWASKEKDRILDELGPRMKEVIVAKANKPKPWWRRLFESEGSQL